MRPNFLSINNLQLPLPDHRSNLFRQITWLCSFVSLPLAAELHKPGNKQEHLDTPFHWELSYTGEQWSIVDGGLNSGSYYLDNLDLIAETTVEILNLPRVKLHGHLLYNNDTSLSEGIGDRQNVSNIDAPEALRLYELWFETDLPWDLSLRAGIYDLNSEFDVTERAQLFLNGSHGMGPELSQSGENGPSIFPITSLAVRGKWALTENWQLQLAALDAVPGNADDPTSGAIQLGDGALHVAELGYTTARRQARAALGHWRYSRSGTGSLSEVNESADGKNYGTYLLMELDLWQDPHFYNRKVGTFLRYGVANRKINELDKYLGLGFTYTSPFANRTEDTAGIALAMARASDAWQKTSADNIADHETSIEATYSLAINCCLTLQPNIQYVINPGLDKSLSNAWVVGLRFQISFSDNRD